MESLSELLNAYSPKEPEEISALKNYIAKEFGSQSAVRLHDNTVIITVGSASLANALRLRLPALKAAAHTTKRLVLRIG